MTQDEDIKACIIREFDKDVYLQTWKKISEGSQETITLAKMVLVWVLNASRSMSVDELERAVAANPQTHNFEPDKVVPGVTLMALCRGLLVLEEESRLVRLAHDTAKEILQRLLDESFPHPHALLARVCMAHLVTCGFQNSTITSRAGFCTALKSDPLLVYASGAWAFHVRHSMDVEDVKQCATTFIMGSRAFPAFTCLESTTRFDILTPLHILALYHLPLDFLDGLDIRNPNILTTRLQQSPLMLASRSAYDSLVDLLLEDASTEVNWAGRTSWSALMTAARYGHDRVAALLLTHPELQVNRVDHEGWAPLVLAARYGHEGVVAALIGLPDIQINLAQLKDQRWSALMQAARNGHEGIVTLLLARPEIEVNLLDEDDWSALMLAARSGHESIVKALLSRPEIQVNVVNNYGCSALMLASIGGHEKLVGALLAAKDIDVNISSPDGDTTLKLVVEDGHEPVVRLLLRMPGVYTTIRRSEDGHTAMSAALAQGHTSIVKLLQEFELRSSVNPDISDAGEVDGITSKDRAESDFSEPFNDGAGG